MSCHIAPGCEAPPHPRHRRKADPGWEQVPRTSRTALLWCARQTANPQPFLHDAWGLTSALRSPLGRSLSRRQHTASRSVRLRRAFRPTPGGPSCPAPPAGKAIPANVELGLSPSTNTVWLPPPRQGETQRNRNTKRDACPLQVTAGGANMAYGAMCASRQVRIARCLACGATTG